MVEALFVADDLDGSQGVGLEVVCSSKHMRARSVHVLLEPSAPCHVWPCSEAGEYRSQDQ